MACSDLFIKLGVNKENLIMIDSKGVINSNRKGLNKWKLKYAKKTKDKNLNDAIKNADVFLGLSSGGILKKEMVKKWQENQLFLLVQILIQKFFLKRSIKIRKDAIIATGRSDYANQVNNLIGFPYIFRGALDVRAKTINEEMKIAAANAIAKLARERVPDEVAAAMGGDRPKYGKDYIIPSTFDPRLNKCDTSCSSKSSN